MRVSYRELGPAQFRAAIRELLAVYSAAMNPPDRTLSGREAIMERHAASPGFRGLTAHDDGRLVGFCYGFHGENGQWWHDMVAAALGSRCGGTGSAGAVSAQRGWLDDSFEIAELHVLPTSQGKGIGRSLLLTIAAGRPERTAVLSTADAPTRARRLYRGVGFTDLLTDFRFSGGEPPYAVMGATLPLDASAAPRSPRPSSW
ncbi:N-acetyltransferase [Trebonia kvetii]|uniref:N-acetyltransferase n=1 Tax=Trebonia kvetii TaxID=2480626 RepID=A0A6P2BW31_9ACTN|nr:GNAT family N-acetyltransferase [Trebonia kvetii]TVZ03120.1 N-acetyltransferase [Trebonia kvetii]